MYYGYAQSSLFEIRICDIKLHIYFLTLLFGPRMYRLDTIMSFIFPPKLSMHKGLCNSQNRLGQQFEFSMETVFLCTLNIYVITIFGVTTENKWICLPYKRSYSLRLFYSLTDLSDIIMAPISFPLTELAKYLEGMLHLKNKILV